MDGSGSGRHELAINRVQIGVDATKMVGQSSGQRSAKHVERDALCNAWNTKTPVK